MAHREEMKIRGVNFWAHIKNWYEVHSLEDNVRLLQDVASMGFNDFWVTLERGDFTNYFDDQVADDRGRQFWVKLEKLAGAAHELGMKVTVLDEINTTFIDQFTDPALAHLVAVKPRPEGLKLKPYLFCLSKPQSWEMIMKNREEAYKRLPFIDAAVIWPYDNGGCGCDACHPYPKTFVERSREIASTLRRYHPDAAVYLSTWDMTDEEKAHLTRLLSEDASGTFQGIVDKEWMLLEFGDENCTTDNWTKLGLPERYEKIPYIDLCQIGAWGWHTFTANPYPARFERMFQAMRRAGIRYYSAYSEDLHDDINKYLIAGLGVNAEKSSRDLIKEYCLRYFQAAVGEDVYQVACMMEDELTNKFASPWVQKKIMNKATAQSMLSILRDVEKRLPGYAAKSFRWQVLIKRAEISVLLNEIGEIDQTRERVVSLFKAALENTTIEETKDTLRKVNVLIQEKGCQLEALREIVDVFRDEVLEEPDDRGITVLSPLPSYFSWKKMLLDMEETVYIASRWALLYQVHDDIKAWLDRSQ